MLFEKIQFESGEEILRVVRKHWFIIVSELFAVFVMALVPFLTLVGLTVFSSELLTESIKLGDYAALITFGITVWLILTLMTAFAIWTNYYLDQWIITDRRIIMIDQLHFFNRNVSVFRLERLQDIEFNVKGLIPTLLNFGTIQAQTAGSFESNFKTRGMPDPRGLQAIIQKAMDQRLALIHNNPNLAG